MIDDKNSKTEQKLQIGKVNPSSASYKTKVFEIFRIFFIQVSKFVSEPTKKAFMGSCKAELWDCKCCSYFPNVVLLLYKSCYYKYCGIACFFLSY